MSNLNEYGPEHVTPANEKPVRWTMGMIDSMAGSRNNFICVMVANPKKPGSIADRNWSLYGSIGKPTVTVAEFVRGGNDPFYPARDGGVTRARASLLWDLQRSYVRIVSLADTTAVETVETDTETVE